MPPGIIRLVITIKTPDTTSQTPNALSSFLGGLGRILSTTRPFLQLYLWKKQI
jgi:hypothetical protein